MDAFWVSLILLIMVFFVIYLCIMLWISSNDKRKIIKRYMVENNENCIQTKTFILKKDANNQVMFKNKSTKHSNFLNRAQQKTVENIWNEFNQYTNEMGHYEERNSSLPPKNNTIQHVKTYINLTQLINASEMQEFKEITKQIVKPVFKSQKPLFKTSIAPTTFGTFASEFISYKINPQEYKKSVVSSGWYEYLPLNIKHKIAENDFVFITFAAITYTVEFYRIGFISMKPFENLVLIETGSYQDKDFEKDFNEFTPLVEKQIKEHIKTREIIFNPTFGSVTSGVKADGDLILNKSLVEIKCSKFSTFKIEYLRQLIGYKCLNNLLSLENQFEINKTFIYWNPFYNIFEKVQVDNFEEIEIVFNKNRINVIKAIKNSKLMV